MQEPNPHPTTNGGRLLKRGDTFDPECHRTTHRLTLARRILAVEGIEPTYVEHDEKCILNPANAWNRCFGFNYRCDPGCPRGTYAGQQPTWPEYTTGAMFDLAYKLADEFQTRRGEWHQSKINEERRARELAAREEAFGDPRNDFDLGLGEVEAI